MREINNMGLVLSSQAFWDIDMESIRGREKEYVTWIIKRVAQYGTVDDMAAIDLFYGREKIMEVMNGMTPAEQSRSMLMRAFVS